MSRLQNPAHTYSAPGSYSVSLTAENAHGANTLAKTGFITVRSVPEADFSQNTAAGVVPLTVDFTDESKFGPTSWSWNFGDSSVSSEQHPSHTYTQPGLYTVGLTATNAHGSDSTIRPRHIQAFAAPLTAAFTSDVSAGVKPLKVQFTDRSTGAPTAWLWKFGDGSTGAGPSPTHEFTLEGIYLVSLTISNASDSSTAERFITVRATALPSRAETWYLY